MSSIKLLVCFFLIRVIFLWHFYAIDASMIEIIDVPSVIRNGTGPVKLSCIYKIDENENGLVVKWYHELNQIYQWIPPLPPQDTGIIANYSKYPAKNLIEPETRSIIDLKMITLDMSGEYMCVIKTFFSEHTKATRMIVYVPESSAKIHVSRFNNSHTNIKCTVLGAQPRPTLELYIEGIKIDDKSDQSSLIIDDNIYKYNFSVIRNVIVKNMINPVLIECEISISETNYKRREKMVYYPDRIKLG
ncbi:PREDICTED: uncharacterized protein LOC107068758 [Polistes dominula]|uniref:Uncharacterized protein LOC107068758 n=1 Tax=Polistes dominula TaxID=743375 RepID=A0ABM1IL72_POLDO|nr:PREDICTED: uncharacterized protein LOC107068758 [Polistes dominula]